MKGWRVAAVIAAAVVVAGVALARSPAAHGRMRAAQVPRVLDVLVGGSRIGVSIRDVDTAEAGKLSPASAGVLVEEVTSGGPAEQAGVRKGDLIVEFDGERVRSVRQFTRLVQETPAGRSVPTTVLREGQRTTMSVTPRESDRARLEGVGDLGAWAEDLRARVIPRAPRAPAPPVPPPPPSSLWEFEAFPGRTGHLGVTVGALSPQLAEYFGTDEGVLVTSVADGSAAAKAGVKAGDVITGVNGSSVRTPADFRRRSQELQDADEFAMSIVRDRKALTLKGTAERTSPRRSVRSSV